MKIKDGSLVLGSWHARLTDSASIRHVENQARLAINAVDVKHQRYLRRHHEVLEIRVLAREVRRMRHVHRDLVDITRQAGHRPKDRRDARRFEAIHQDIDKGVGNGIALVEG